MIKRYTNHIAVCIIFFLLHQLSARQDQVIVDSLKEKTNDEYLIQIRVHDSILSKEYSYEELYYRYYNSITKKEKERAAEYANAYIKKAKIESDSIRLADGYYNLAYLLKDQLANIYMDSVIAISYNQKNKRYPAAAYILKGSVFYNKRAFKKALDNYILANEYARKNYSPDLILYVNHEIGLLKDRIGEYEEALKLHKENYNYLKKADGYKTNNKQYLNNLFAMVQSFYRLNKLDSASTYNSIGIEKSLKAKNRDMYNYFKMTSGVISFFQNDFNKAKDSINQAINYFKGVNNKPNLAVGYYYLGKINYESENIEKGIFYFKKLDTIFQQQKDILPETRDGYEVLIDHYKKTNNQEQQLVYIEKLIEVDSVLNSNYRYLQKKITQNYDTPLLIQEKDQIIGSLKDERVISRFGLVILGLVSALTAILLFLNYRKRKKYQERFENLLNQKNGKKEVLEQIEEIETKQTEDIGISETIVKNILASLSDFENRQLFLTPNITTAGLAKQFETNAKYLSKVVNFYKQKSFIAYINDLRIDYVVEKLQTDQKLRNYTIKAIAREIGFNTTEAFSKSFLKKTGIYPSYFIKQLEKNQF
ncbi:helix-turn-helix domain-containing protein [Aquimarina sp. MMG015]|uniref:helix-turn-helix domain-containing protein n=1 Tax=Aquimarina sp. MMG015 TaxID=2822689 RepID=UPI001B3A269F|nr:helix-turn-helix domain-containing protein [Aquimarina sp. MMG015]MBQ4801739.1 helix-turn-helix domain-containing protein [Aquimarina sp. MMG015]